jgi:hypothetical protein
MDVAVLNDAREDLAERLSALGISGVTDYTWLESKEQLKESSGAWLAELETIYPLAVIEGVLEYYLSTRPQHLAARVEDALDFYLQSLREWQLTTVINYSAKENQ